MQAIRLKVTFELTKANKFVFNATHVQSIYLNIKLDQTEGLVLI